MDNNNQVFNNNEFTFLQKAGANGGSEFVGGGYTINSFFLNGNIPVMTTMNSSIFTTDDTADYTADDGNDTGNGINHFENLAVPAGLFYMNQRQGTNKIDNDDMHHSYQQRKTATDDLIDKLFGLVEIDKKKQRKTRKHVKTKINANQKQGNKKTRKQK